jgi:hypothetical protein
MLHTTCVLLPAPLSVFQGQLLPRLEDESPVSLIKALLFFAKLGPGHVEMFEKVRIQPDQQQA